MKYFKLGLLAATLSLVALVIALDKKENGCKQCEGEGSFDDSKDKENNIVIEDTIIEETITEDATIE